MGRTVIRQHEPLRVPDGWKEQDRTFVIQLERLIDEIYVLLSKLDERVKALEEEE